MSPFLQRGRSHKRERNAIVTIAIGNADYAALTVPTLQAYASRIQVPLVIIREQILPEARPSFEKTQLAELLDEYDRILYLDADIIVTPHAPDIFKLPIPKNHLAAVIDKSEKAIREKPDELGFDGWGDKDFSVFERLLGPIGKPREKLYYVNTGMMLVSKSHQGVFEELREKAATASDHVAELCTRGEQSMLNYLLNKQGIPWHPLDKRWNHILGHRDPAPPWIQQSYFAHYAGTSPKNWAILSHFPELLPYARTNPFTCAPDKHMPAETNVKLDQCHLELIYGLLLSHKPRAVLELGIGSGAVTDLILKSFDYNNLPDVKLTCVDIWMDWNNEKPAEVKYYEDRGVEVITSDEHEFIKACDSTYDFIISDADHFRAEQWFDETLNLLNPGGILIYHDVTNPKIPNLGNIVSEVNKRGIRHLLLNTSSRGDERCERGLLVIQKAAANES